MHVLDCGCRSEVQLKKWMRAGVKVLSFTQQVLYPKATIVLQHCSSSANAHAQQIHGEIRLHEAGPCKNLQGRCKPRLAAERRMPVPDERISSILQASDVQDD